LVGFGISFANFVWASLATLPEAPGLLTARRISAVMDIPSWPLDHGHSAGQKSTSAWAKTILSANSIAEPEVKLDAIVKGLICPRGQRATETVPAGVLCTQLGGQTLLLEFGRDILVRDNAANTERAWRPKKHQVKKHRRHEFHSSPSPRPRGVLGTICT